MRKLVRRWPVAGLGQLRPSLMRLLAGSVNSAIVVLGSVHRASAPRRAPRCPPPASIDPGLRLDVLDLVGHGVAMDRPGGEADGVAALVEPGQRVLHPVL